MTLYHFNLLSYDIQLAYTYREGTFLATRWQAEMDSAQPQCPSGTLSETT